MESNYVHLLKTISGYLYFELLYFMELYTANHLLHINIFSY